MKTRLAIAASAFALATVMAGAANAATITVNGTDDPFLAGATSGNYLTWDTGDVDTFDNEGPISISVTGGQTLHISGLTGTVSNCGCTFYGPAGGPNYPSDSFTPTGYTPIVAGYSSLPINGLVGVFNNSALNTLFTIASDGTIHVPTGATKLYFGTVDGYQWNNNQGAFSFNISAVPEPATWAMFLLGFGAIGWTLRGSRKSAAAATA